MARRIPLLILLFLLATVAHTEPPRVYDETGLTDPPERLVLVELWRRGDEDDELFFGAIRNVSLGPDGNIYALDTQRSQVTVFDPEGNFLRNPQLCKNLLIRPPSQGPA